MGKKKKKTIKNAETDYNQSFDDIINEILGEDNSTKKSDKEEFEELIQEVSQDLCLTMPPTCIEEVENTQIYKFSDNASIGIFNNPSLDTSLTECYREKTLIQTSDLLEVTGYFNTSELKIEKHPDNYKYGHVKFFDKQKCDILKVEKVGLFGSFDAAVVSINDSTYVDIDIDITDKSKCTYLLVDTRFERVRGRINLSKDFYNQLNNENFELIYNIIKCDEFEIQVENMPLDKYIASEKVSENINIEYSNIRDILNDMRVYT